MPTDPYPGTPSPNTLADATKLRAQLDAVFDGSPRVRVYYNANIGSVTGGTPAFMPFNAELYDQPVALPMHDNTTNNSRLTCRVAGLYFVKACIKWQYHANPGRSLALYKNGVIFANNVLPGAPQPAGLETTLQVVDFIPLAVNDYVQVSANQYTGGNLDILGDATGVSYAPHFQMTRIGA